MGKLHEGDGTRGMKYSGAILAVVALILAVILAVVPARTQETAAPATPPAEYRLQFGDTVDVRFFYNPEINEQNVVIRPDGRISLQLIGDVQFAGKTVEEVCRDLEEQYAKILKTPRASVQIRAYGAQKAYVTGEVPRPGTIQLTSTMSVLAAINEAGGVTIRGNRNRAVLVRRMSDGKPAQREIKLFENKQPTQDALLALQPFDVILVPETKIARADRWVDQHIRQLIPLNMNAGFTYLWQNLPGTVIPPF